MARISGAPFRFPAGISPTVGVRRTDAREHYRKAYRSGILRCRETTTSRLNVAKRGHANDPKRSPFSSAWNSGCTDERRTKHRTCLRPDASAPWLLCAGTSPTAALYCCQSRQGCGWQRCKRRRRGSRPRSNRRQCGTGCGDWRHCGWCRWSRPSGLPALNWLLLLISTERRTDEVDLDDDLRDGPEHLPQRRPSSTHLCWEQPHDDVPSGVDLFGSDCPRGSLERCASGMSRHPERVGR